MKSLHPKKPETLFRLFFVLLFLLAGLLAKIANYGIASVKRIYGDWTPPNLNSE